MATYETLANDKVQFLQGSQANLNLYLPVSTNAKRGTAIEGAFYLTTDTHRLYIGRKVEESGNPDNGLVFPVQVSAGITTVANTADLTQISTDGEQGDMYYIQDGNVLAVLEINPTTGERSWVQVNPPTGITGFRTDVISQTGAVRVSSQISTQAGNSAPADFRLVEGRNITLTATAASSTTNQDGSPTTPAQIVIDGVDYSLETTATTAGTGGVYNGANVGLIKNSGNSFDSSLTISGDASIVSGQGRSTIAASSDANGNITIEGPRFNNITTQGKAAGGFDLSLNYYNPLLNDSASVLGTLDPIIAYGHNGTINGNTHTPSSVHFVNGTATLNVYTKAEVEDKINEYISSEFETANAMNYRGAFTSATDLANQITANGGAHIGDTYKCATTSTSGITLDQETVYKGDLVILRGTEGSDGIIPNNNIVYDIIPSGDEPLLTASAPSVWPSGYDTNSDPGITKLSLSDAKTGGYGTILDAWYQGSSYIKITSSFANKKLTLNFEHEDVARNQDSSSATLTPLTGSITDGLGNNAYEIFVLTDPTDVKRDAKGHLTGVVGKKINLQHNRLSTITSTYGTTTSGSGSSALRIGRLDMQVDDILGNPTYGRFELSSQTLTFSGGTNSTALNVELLWGSF